MTTQNRNAAMSDTTDHGHKHQHSVPLMTLFLALLALTAGEVALFEIWTVTHFVPKFVMVLMLLILTLPKAAIVMIYFMHLKFEKQFVVWLAIGPLLLVLIAIAPTLVDAVTLRNNDRTLNHVPGLAEWVPPHMHTDHHQDHAKEEPAG